MFWIVSSLLCYGQARFETKPHWNADQIDNVYQDPELIRYDRQGYPTGWSETATFESGLAVVNLEVPKGSIRLTCPKDGGVTSVSTTIDLPKRVRYVTILTRMRGPSIELGESETSGAGMVYTLVNRSGKLREYPRVEPIYKYGSLRSWKTYRSTIRVLPGYQQLKVSAMIEDAKGFFEIDRLLVVPSEPDFQPTDEQIQQLRTAVSEDDAAAITKLVSEAPELVDWRDGSYENGTPLIHASWHNSAKVAEELLRLGANPEAYDDSWKNRPLDWCSYLGCVEVAEVLINAGAKTEKALQMAERRKSMFQSSKSKRDALDRIINLINAKHHKN